MRGEQHLYLRQPGYGTSYVVGKLQIEELLAEVALIDGDDFSVKDFFDRFYAAGVIPITLVRWEMTGEKRSGPGPGALRRGAFFGEIGGSGFVALRAAMPV